MVNAKGFLASRRLVWLGLLALLLAGRVWLPAGSWLDVVEFSSQTLSNNPLHDPVVRRLAIFVPAASSNLTRLPIIYFLPGYGGSADDFIENRSRWLAFHEQLAARVAPALFVVVDGRNRWGGSQYLNSPAQGCYADYLCEEIVSRVEARFGLTTNRPSRILAGHSSGGFGALRLGMLRPDLFDAIVALSPDSDFQNTHLPLVLTSGVSNATPTEIRDYMAAEMKLPMPKDDDLTYALGLSAAYAPAGQIPGQFQWLYNTQGQFQTNIWQRWLTNDPLTIVTANPRIFRPNQAIYLEGPAEDQYGANIGARKIYEVIRTAPAHSTFYEPPGRHSDHLPERIERGVAWVFGRPTRDIK